MEANEINEMDILSDMVTMYSNQITDSYLFMSNSLRLLNQYEQSTSNMINTMLGQRNERINQNTPSTNNTQRLRNDSRNLINYLRTTRPPSVRTPSVRTPRRTVTNVDGNLQVSVNNNSNTDTLNDAAQLVTTIDNLIQSLTVDLDALSPVVVAPTEAQINNATELIHYGNIENPINTRCPITLVDFGENDRIRQIIPCGHCFNNRALLRWFTTNCRCPICRSDIRDYNPMNVIRNPYSNNQQRSSSGTNSPDNDQNV